MLGLKRFSESDPFLSFMKRMESEVLDADHGRYLQGFSVTYDPLWSVLGRRLRSGIRDDLDPAWVAAVLPEEHYFTGDFEDERLREEWNERVKKSREPFIVKVCLTPTTVSTRPLRRKLEDLCRREQAFTAICEDREAARFVSLEGGRPISVGTFPGTAGGFLQDQHGNEYGVTCGHVGRSVGQQVNIQDNAGVVSQAGQVSHTIWPLTATPQASLCNNQNGGPPNDVDIALFKPSSGQAATKHVRQLGDVTDILPLANISSGHSVKFAGSTSGVNKYVIAGYLVIYRFQQGSSSYCFKDLFEISGVPSPRLFGVFGTYVPVPQPGDSGGWICCPDPNGDQALCGMLLAADNNRGYACFTDQMLNWANGKGASLKVL